MLSANLDQAKEVGPRREGYFCTEDDCLHKVRIATSACGLLAMTRLGGRIATGLTALAMTDVVDGLRLGFDFLCHCCPVFAAVLGNSTKKHTKKRSAVLLSSAFCIIL